MMNPALVLASGSPRRLELLALLGLEPEVQPAEVDETPVPGELATRLARRLAESKCAEVSRSRPGALVLAADTVVAVEGEILGKPVDLEDSRRMLVSLSGRVHQVHTGVALGLGERQVSILDTADVRFRELTPAEIEWYLDTAEGEDKAGGYAIQGAGGMLIEGIVGSPHTVIGLPLSRLPELFSELGFDLVSML